VNTFAGAVEGAPTPEEQAILAVSLGQALLIVLQTLTPAERICFVLHDTFAVPFDQIAIIVDKSPEACRQPASRARRRVRTGNDPNADPLRQREVVSALLFAATTGNFETLATLLDRDVVLFAAGAAVALGARPSTRRQRGGVNVLRPSKGCEIGTCRR
jgi:RNA polymerase sigma-70 factor (ECF subfamily)